MPDEPAQDATPSRRGPRIRYRRDGEGDAQVVEFDESVDGIELLERCFKKHGMNITPESAARCDAVLKRRADEKKPWLRPAKNARKR